MCFSLSLQRWLWRFSSQITQCPFYWAQIIYHCFIWLFKKDLLFVLEVNLQHCKVKFKGKVLSSPWIISLLKILLNDILQIIMVPKIFELRTLPLKLQSWKVWYFGGKFIVPFLIQAYNQWFEVNGLVQFLKQFSIHFHCLTIH